MPPKNVLTKKSKTYLTVEIEGKTYDIPTMKSLKVKEVRKFMKIRKLSEEEQFEFMLDFFGQYISEEVLDEMYNDDLDELMTLWKKANEGIADDSDALPGMTSGDS